jgi:ubiquinone/menaquinone biosynthesis C-methylase UbiE
MADMDTEMIEHYGGDPIEDTRLARSPHGRLEYLRTQELIRRWLRKPGARVLDIGGGTGIHAAWLARDGHTVHVVDMVPSHVETANARGGISAEVGDARHLTTPDQSVDVALILGPLYHLKEHSGRARALAEAVRVLRPGGLLVAAGISRYLSCLEAGSDGRLTAEMRPSIETVITTGRYDGHLGFVAAHFHTAEELREEVRSAGLQEITVYGVEGPAWPALDNAGMSELDSRIDAALRCARIVEQDPSLINASAHLLAIARR